MKKYRGRKSRDTAPLNFRNKKPYISSTTVQCTEVSGSAGRKTRKVDPGHVSIH